MKTYFKNLWLALCGKTPLPKPDLAGGPNPTTP